MAWITEAQADNFLGVNPEWDAFTNKAELLDLASNRLEQLTFKDEPIDRVEARYVDGNSLSKVASSDDFLLNAQAGNFEYHEALGWFQDNAKNDLIIYEVPHKVMFDVAGNLGGKQGYTQNLELRAIQNLQTFGGTFTGTVALDSDAGDLGFFSAFETNQATSLVDKNGDQIFTGSTNRRVSGSFAHDGTHVISSQFSYGYENLVFNGVDTVEVINEVGDTVTITLPEVFAGDLFTYEVKITNGFENTLFVYINDVLVGNPIFDTSGQNKSRLQYSSGTSSAENRHSYIRVFGAMINAENPITIPIRLVGACALLALEFGKFPQNYTGDKEYLENENNYARMQDLPINVQAAVEPFLASYVGVTEDGIATTDDRGKEPVEPKVTIKDLEYE